MPQFYDVIITGETHAIDHILQPWQRFKTQHNRIYIVNTWTISYYAI